MPENLPAEDEFDESVLKIQIFLWVLLAVAAGFLLATFVLPMWIPDMATSLLGSSPKAYWYLSRGTAFIALSLLWLSMALGLGLTNKMARLWPGLPPTFAIHEYVSLLGLAFALFHALILLGDHYINFTVAQVLIPFAASGYRPVWVGIGQLGFYVWVIVAFSFYVRRHIGHKTWRLIHYISFPVYLMGLFHGITSGTDASTVWATLYYWISAGSLLFLLIYRLLVATLERSTAVQKHTPVRRPDITVNEQAPSPK